VESLRGNPGYFQKQKRAINFLFLIIHEVGIGSQNGVPDKERSLNGVKKSVRS
jgi:hypothetical protein